MEILRMLREMTSSDDYDAIDLLKKDHAAVAELFECYETLHDSEEKRAWVSSIIRRLTVHARIEEELFYPTLRRWLPDQTVVDEGDVEHALIRKLMADLYRSPADSSHFDAKVRSLAQLVEHHVEEEEAQMFHEARASTLNLVAIGGQLDAYRAALESRYELDTDGLELAAFLSAPTVLDPETESDATMRRTSRGATSGAPENSKVQRRIGGPAIARQRRVRASGRPEAGASKGEST